MLTRNTIAIGLAGAALVAVPMQAQALKLFGGPGSGAVFRGSVGTALAPVQEKVLTPIVQGAVVVATTSAAFAVGGPLVAPVGVAVGNAINDIAAGGGGGAEPAPAQVQPASQPQAAAGSKCSTEVAGDFPLTGPAPVSSACTVKLSNGKELNGRVAL